MRGLLSWDHRIGAAFSYRIHPFAPSFLCFSFFDRHLLQCSSCQSQDAVDVVRSTSNKASRMPSFSACFLSSGVRAAPPRGKSTSSRGLKVDETSVGTCWIWSSFRFFCPLLSEPGASALSESLNSDDFRFAEGLVASRRIPTLREKAFWASGILALGPNVARKWYDRHERKKFFFL